MRGEEPNCLGIDCGDKPKEGSASGRLYKSRDLCCLIVVGSIWVRSYLLRVTYFISRSYARSFVRIVLKGGYVGWDHPGYLHMYVGDERCRPSSMD